MDIIETMKKAQTVRGKLSQQILLDCCNKIEENIDPSHQHFFEVFDVIYKATNYYNNNPGTPTESQIAGDVLRKFCSYLYNRAHNNNEPLKLLEELIILTSLLYADVKLNEPTKKLPNNTEVNNDE